MTTDDATKSHPRHDGLRAQHLDGWTCRHCDAMTQQREAEARRVAADEQFPILSHSDQWRYFTLDDGQIVNRTEGQFPNIQIVGTKVIRTHFEWVEESGRFEGFVS